MESPEEMGYDTIQYNLSESSVADLTLADIGPLNNSFKLGYTDHKGKPELRQLLATQYNDVQPGEILLTCGAATALFMVNTALLTASDHLIVLHPNYATNIEVPKAIGCSIAYIHLQIENRWAVSIDAIADAITPETKLISITSPHNPTGMVLEEDELKKLIALAEEKNIHLLVDETYRDICFNTPYPIAASMSNKIISISSLSKAYGLPGLRIGWLVTKDKSLFEKLLAAKEMIHITNSALDEEACFSFLQKKDFWKKKINQQALENLSILKAWLERENRLEYVLPKGGVVCFPAIKKELGIDCNLFYQALFATYGTMVGPGHWFNMPDRYMRIGFGWIDKATLTTGLDNISKCLDDCSNKPCMVQMPQ